jgi:superfamily II DNA or RNA helicase/HKD family nuclease
MQKPPPSPLPPGLYEALVTDDLARRIAAIQAVGSHAALANLDPADGYELLAHHLFCAVRDELRAAPQEDRLLRQAHLVNQLLELLSDSALAVQIPTQVLHAVVEPTSYLPGTPGTIGSPALPERPMVPLSQSDLLVNARGEPGIGRALSGEIPSADRIDLLCAFIKWNGLRVLLPALQSHRARGRALRVITTTYIGATEKRALDALEQLGAEIKISFETRTTRLHAKAWLLFRESGFTTAFIGSSNLSRTALLDGLEWNVRLSAVVNPDVIDKFAATFESYWQDPAFEAYAAARDGTRLEQALRRAAGGGAAADIAGTQIGAAPILDVHAYPHQREILESLRVARERHDRHRNLVVAATGTGKTVIAALDYRELCQKRQATERGASRPSLLFVAHRKEILEQSLRTFRTVLRDGAFGELYVDGHRPDEWKHVFASIQSLAHLSHDQIQSDHFDVMIVDEFHHVAARTYSDLLHHLRPQELLGLTATPERTDGQSVLAWFDDRIAAELRLWEALDRQLLCPLQYFGVHDDVDLSNLSWRRGGYEVADLEKVYTGNDARVRLVLQALRDKVNDPLAMRALGFCVSISHAKFMASRFSRAGIPARAVSAHSSSEERDDALRALRDCKVNALFAVDLFNEGVDVPEIDTVLFLRPTESATVFLQQLGRGLRHAQGSGKSCLTALDFIGQAHRHFRFDRRFRALTGTTRAGLRRAVEEGFPYLPAGCSIQLDRVASALVLGNIKRAIGFTRRTLVDELRSLHRDVTLFEFLREADLEIEDVYRVRGWSWTSLRGEAGLPTPLPGPDAGTLDRTISQILHWDDPERLAAYRAWLTCEEAPRVREFPERERRMAMALIFGLFGWTRKWTSLQQAFDGLWDHPAQRVELRQLVDLLEERANRLPQPLNRVLEGWTHPVPLSVHSRYSLVDILTGFDLMNFDHPHLIREGVKYDKTTRTDLFFVTLEKSEKHYSPTTLYRDYAISPTRFHWESQSQTPSTSNTGQRYIHHAERGSHVLFFVRLRDKEGGQTVPYTFIGPARYLSHKGDKPMAIVWEILRELPADFYAEVKLAAG